MKDFIAISFAGFLFFFLIFFMLGIQNDDLISLEITSDNEKIGFCTLLEKTLNCPEQNEAICQKCGKLARFASTRRVRLLPNILTLDMTASTEAGQAFWISHIQVSCFEF